MPLKAADKKVIKAFADKKAASGKLLDTDGKSLEKSGMGGGKIAWWEGNHVKLAENWPYVKNDEMILRFMKKEIPKNWWKDKWVWSRVVSTAVSELRRRGKPKLAKATARLLG